MTSNERVAVWITGASKGIGSALARSVPFADADVVNVSRSAGASGVEHLQADLAKPSDWLVVERHLRERLGQGDYDRAILIHCAGMLAPMGFTGTVDTEAYAANVLLNSAAPQVLGHMFLGAVREAGCRGELLQITSDAATNTFLGWTGYCAGKAAVDQWVRVAGAEHAELGTDCRILAVHPGVVETQMQEEIRATSADRFPAVDAFVALHDEGKLLSPEESARGIWGLFDLDLPTVTLADPRELGLVSQVL